VTRVDADRSTVGKFIFHLDTPRHSSIFDDVRGAKAVDDGHGRR